MSDQSVITTSHHRGQRARRGEYAIYFSVILIVALPFAAAAWAVHLMRHRRLPVMTVRRCRVICRRAAGCPVNLRVTTALWRCRPICRPAATAC
ncbi:MAG: cytochrome PufQ [Gemmobacter sp.]